MKILGGCVLFLAILAIWVFVLQLASKGFFELRHPLGYIFTFVYIGLTVAAIAKWQNYSSDRDHYIIVHLSVTDEQRKALAEQATAWGYADTYGGCRNMWQTCSSSS